MNPRGSRALVPSIARDLVLGSRPRKTASRAGQVIIARQEDQDSQNQPDHEESCGRNRGGALPKTPKQQND
jgi:hypothetical protein